MRRIASYTSRHQVRSYETATQLISDHCFTFASQGLSSGYRPLPETRPLNPTEIARLCFSPTRAWCADTASDVPSASVWSTRIGLPSQRRGARYIAGSSCIALHTANASSPQIATSAANTRFRSGIVALFKLNLWGLAWMLCRCDAPCGKCLPPTAWV